MYSAPLDVNLQSEGARTEIILQAVHVKQAVAVVTNIHSTDLRKVLGKRNSRRSFFFFKKITTWFSSCMQLQLGYCVAYSCRATGPNPLLLSEYNYIYILQIYIRDYTEIHNMTLCYKVLVIYMSMRGRPVTFCDTMKCCVSAAYWMTMMNNGSLDR